MVDKNRVRMGDVWERTTEVLSGRAGILAGIAAIGIFLPGVVRDAYAAFASPVGTANVLIFGGIGLLLSIAIFFVTIWTQLTIIAVASDPATTTAMARAQAASRLAAAIGVFVVVGAIFVLLALPPVVVLAGSGIDFQAMAATGQMPSIPPGVGGFITLYFLAYAILVFWLGSRLILVNPVVLHERRGLGAIKRSFALTRGLTWRLIGVMILFAVVVGIAVMATTMIAGLVFRLILGGDAAMTVQFLASVVTLVVTTGFTVVAAVFTAQLYVAVGGLATPE